MALTSISSLIREAGLIALLSFGGMAIHPKRPQMAGVNFCTTRGFSIVLFGEIGGIRPSPLSLPRAIIWALPPGHGRSGRLSDHIIALTAQEAGMAANCMVSIKHLFPLLRFSQNIPRTIAGIPPLRLR